MRRREFITLLSGAAAAWPLAPRAQPGAKVSTVGFIGTSASGFSSWTAVFAKRLVELSQIDHRAVAIEYRWSEGRTERVAEIGQAAAPLRSVMNSRRFMQSIPNRMILGGICPAPVE